MRASGSGTDSIINLTVRSRRGQRLVDFNIPDTAQEDQETGQANLYFVSVDVPFTLNDLDPGAVTITTAGNDEWLPANMFVFALDGLGQERPTFLAPLGPNTRNWQLGALSTPAGEGKPTVTLPLVPSSHCERVVGHLGGYCRKGVNRDWISGGVDPCAAWAFPPTST